MLPGRPVSRVQLVRSKAFSCLKPARMPSGISASRGQEIRARLSKRESALSPSGNEAILQSTRARWRRDVMFRMLSILEKHRHWCMLRDCRADSWTTGLWSIVRPLKFKAANRGKSWGRFESSKFFSWGHPSRSRNAANGKARATSSRPTMLIVLFGRRATGALLTISRQKRLQDRRFLRSEPYSSDAMCARLSSERLSILPPVNNNRALKFLCQRQSNKQHTVHTVEIRWCTAKKEGDPRKINFFP